MTPKEAKIVQEQCETFRERWEELPLFALITWSRPKGIKGHQCVYLGSSQLQDRPAEESSWSLAVEINDRADTELNGKVLMRVRPLVDDAPFPLGTRFKLYEGATLFAEGEIVNNAYET